MKNLLFTGAIYIILTAPAIAQECNVDAVIPIADSCADRDQGYKPSTSCTAEITAPDGFFLLGGEVESTTEGTTYEDPSSTSTTPYNHSVVEENSFFKTAILQSASITARCSRGGGGVGDRTCHAKAEIVGKAYPHPCLRIKLEEILDGL